jgi:uncharacterized protein
MLKLSSKSILIIGFVASLFIDCSGSKSKVQEQKNISDTLAVKVNETKNTPAVDTAKISFDISIEGYKATQLGQAVYSGDLAKVKDLLKSGASNEKCLSDGTYIYDILYTSIIFDKIDIFKYVIFNKLYSSVNVVYTEESETPLTAACNISNCKESFEMADSLVALGANVNGAGASGGDITMYPIINAVNNNNAELVKLLIQHGANKEIKNEKGETPLTIAQKKEFNNIVDILQ